MPEYLAPGVYVEETSFRAKSIEGVGTSTTGFVGAARYGPVEGEPELITSFSQFERIYGGLDPLKYNDADRANYLAYAVRAFFDNGGSRLYVARTFSVEKEEEEKNSFEEMTAKASIPAPKKEIAQAREAASTTTNEILKEINQKEAALFAAEEALIAVKRLAEGQEPTWDQLLQTVNGQLEPTQREQPSPISSARAILKTDQATIAAAYNQPAADENVIKNTPIESLISAVKTEGTTAKNSADDIQKKAKKLTEDTQKLTEESANEQAATDIVTVATEIITIASKTTTAATAITNAARKADAEFSITLENAQNFWQARFPGEAGNIQITVSGRLGENVLRSTENELGENELRVGLQNGDLVILKQESQSENLYAAAKEKGEWQFTATTGSKVPLKTLSSETQIYPLQISVIAELPGRFSQTLNWNELTISKLSSRTRNSVNALFSENIVNRQQRLETPVVLKLSSDDWEPADIADSLLNLGDKAEFVENKTKTVVYQLEGGKDGIEPTEASYSGIADLQTGIKSGLKSLEDLEEIAIVAAPGYSHSWSKRNKSILSISQHLISHCDRLKYRVAVLDSPDNIAISGIRKYRGALDTTRAALYYPWVTIVDPISNQQVNLPPSGFVAGIYARNDVENGVHKAPANEVVRGAIALETTINKAQQDILNPDGINCIRFFEGRGIRVWGARTISSDPEWKYLNIRRYFAYLEASIDKATQWAVFQPNGDSLWDNVRRAVEGFLENEWREGRLAGSKLEQAFFVRCDRSTMTQNDLDNGRLLCLIGVAPLYPAEFVIFRIGQWTADRR